MAVEVFRAEPGIQVITAPSYEAAEHELRRVQGQTVVVLLPAGAPELGERHAARLRAWTKEGRRLVVAVAVADWRAALNPPAPAEPAPEAPPEKRPTRKRKKAAEQRPEPVADPGSAEPEGSAGAPAVEPEAGEPEDNELGNDPGAEGGGE